MSEDKVVPFHQKDEIDDPLTEILRAGAKRLIEQAVEAEFSAFLCSHADLKLPDGRQRVVRHGHDPVRPIQTGIGPVEVEKPKARDRGALSAAERIRYSSLILPKWARRTKSLDVLLPALYLRGISTGDFQEVLTALLGKDAPNLSPAVIARLKGEWEDEYKLWQKRELSARRYVYVWADGVYLQARMEPQAECMLVLIGATPEGKKELLGFRTGMRESAQSWKELLVDLKARGLSIAPEIAVGDGALGFWRALDEAFPSTRHQRCWQHKTLNVLDKLPKSVQPNAHKDLREIWLSPNRAAAEAAMTTFAEKYAPKYQKAVDCLLKDHSRNKGFEDIVVQDLSLNPRVTRYRRERWETPDGKTIIAALDPGFVGGYGPNLHRLVLTLHFSGQVTCERIVALLNGMGVVISKRQVVRLLTAKLETFRAEDEAVLKAGLRGAYVTVDDTGARHAGKNGYTTQIGSYNFTTFRTGPSKSRLAFLSRLCGGASLYVINDAALAYMEERNLPQIVIGKFKEHKARIFSSAGDWERHLQALGLSGLKVAPDPVLVASEAALWGAIHHQGLLPDTVIVSDDAGQFRVGAHALCWIHAERLVHKLVPANDKQRNAIEIAKRMIWWFYRALKEYKLTPRAEQAGLLRARFDRIFKRASTGYVTLDRLLRRLFRNKDGLLRVLERPEIPINTNASENDIRAFVTKRKISGGTVSEKGRDARDIMLGLAKTCMKLKLSFYEFIGDRLGIPGPNIPHLASLIQPAPA